MSWDVVLFSSRQKISSPEDIDEEQFVPIGFSEILRGYFPNAKQDGDQYTVDGNGFSIVFSVNDEPESNTLLHLYGEQAMFELINISRNNGWQIFDTGLDEMIDLDNPANNGYANFQSYLAQVLNDKR